MGEAAISVENLVLARFDEFLDHRTPWHRRLWQVGSLLMLEEVLECAHGVSAGIMREDALEYIARRSASVVERDVGFGVGKVRDLLLSLLENPVDRRSGLQMPDQADHLKHLIERIRPNYMSNWGDALADRGPQPEQLEFMARTFVAHLLDAGFASDHLHGWVRSLHDAQRNPNISLADVYAQAAEMLKKEPVAYTVTVPFSTLPHAVIKAAGERFLPWNDLLGLTQQWNVAPPPMREGPGALQFCVTAREPRAALAMAELEVRRLTARIAVGLHKAAVIPGAQALVIPSGRPRWLPLDSQPHEILISSITRYDLLLPRGRSDTLRQLDDALELLAAAESATSWTAVGAMWAALEGLLTRPKDAGVKAAERMASIIAASSLRAELTGIVDAVASQDTPLGADLRHSKLSLTHKITTVTSHIQSCSLKQLSRASDEAAVQRVRSLLADPHTVVRRVEAYFQDAFRRLYVQRNLLLHGGRFDSVALPATMRTLPSLVGAGLDRIVHAAMQTPAVEPLQLAARAELEISLLSQPGARALHRLLE
jgi:hypothetical protein